MEKICFIIPNLKTGGGNRVFIELANELSENQCQVEIIYPFNSIDKTNFQISPNVSIKYIGKYQASNVGKLWNLFYLSLFVYRNRKDYKIVISDPFISIVFIFFPKKNLYRFIQGDDYSMFDDGYIINNKLLLRLYKQLIVFSYQQKFRYIFNSQHVYNTYVFHSGRSDVPKILVHPGLNQNFRDKNIRVWGSKINICLMARRHPSKGFLDFIKAWDEAKGRLKDRIDTIYIISHDDLRKFNIEEFVLINPKSDEEISFILNSSHVFISTSWNEGFGLPALEAMACGCACIISKSGGASEYAKDGENCLMYSPRNIDELVQHMSDGLDDNQRLRELGKNGTATARKFYLQVTSREFLSNIGS